MNQDIQLSRQEVMLFLEKEGEQSAGQYLSSVESNWQPGDLLPQSDAPDFFDEIRNIILYILNHA